MDEPKDEPRKPSGRHRWPRTFLRRQGQITRRQKQALRELWPQYGLRYRYGQTLDLEAAFGRAAPLALDIGFGRGESLIALAGQRPGWNVLGIEVHRPGLGAALLSAQEAGLENLRVLRGDALLVLEQHLEGAPLSECCVFFSDPWPREKDAGRRLVGALLARLVAARMQPGGLLRLATDVEVYAHHMVRALSSVPKLWENTAAPGPFAPRPGWRPMTHYEAKGLREGRQVFDLCYRRTQAPAQGS
jgi:tRNA (guanine-N7-)-methyltransferase